MRDPLVLNKKDRRSASVNHRVFDPSENTTTHHGHSSSLRKRLRTLRTYNSAGVFRMHVRLEIHLRDECLSTLRTRWKHRVMCTGTMLERENA